MYNELVQENYSSGTIETVYTILKGCFRQAMRNGLIERNPIELAELPRKREKEIRQAMTKEQQDLFMKYAKDSWLYNLFALLLRTGLRSGGIRGLKYSDIEL